jgi:hypothetical protein
MKAIKSIVVSTLLLLSHSVATSAADLDSVISQSSVSITTGTDGGQVQSTTVSLDRADLSQPHILRVQGSAGNAPVKMARVDLKINGKIVRSIANNSLELNLAPLMQTGRYELEISGTSPQLDDTISVDFIGKNTNVSQQFSGTGTIKQILTINVQ